MKAVLLNDTRCEDHIGCELVIGNIVRLCKQFDIEVIKTILISDPDPIASVKKVVESVDLLLLNGEGTMHDDAPKALKYAEAVAFAKAQGVKCVLMNSVWQRNSKLNEYLKFFDLIYCRESLSAAEINALGYEAVVVPDMTFATEAHELPKVGKKFDLLIIDSVDKCATTQLRRLSYKWRVPFLPMNSRSLRKERKSPIRFTLHSVLGFGLIKDPISQTLPLIASARYILSGRFHGVCFSMLFGIPVIAISSNTHKLQGLFQDIGISKQEILMPAQLADKQNLKKRLKDNYMHSIPIKNYIRQAKDKYLSMFSEISGLIK